MMKIVSLLALLLAASPAAAQVTGGFGALMPSQGVATGGQDPSGNMQPLKVDVTGALQTTAAAATPNNVTATGSITAAQNVAISTQSIGNIHFVVSGTWTGTLVFEESVNGTTWGSASAIPLPTLMVANGPSVLSTTANGTWEARGAGIQGFRVRGNTVTSGAAVVWITGSTGTDYVLAHVVNDGITLLTSTTPLGAGGSITTGAIDMLPFVSAEVTAYSNVASATNGVVIETSVDGVTWITDTSNTYLAVHAEHYMFGRRARYMRFTFTNGATPQATFQLQVIGERVSSQENNVQLTETLDSDDTAMLVRSVITGFTTGGGGGYVNVKVNPSGALVGDFSNSTGLAGTMNQGTPAVTANAWPIHLVDAGNVNQAVVSAAGAVKVDGSAVTQPVSGTFWQATQPVSSTQLPAALGPAAATAALSIGPSTVATAIDTGTCTNVSVNATVLASNAARKVAIILNNGTASVSVKLGATATTANPPLQPGQSLTLDGPAVYTGQIDVIASTGTQSVCAYSW